MVVIIVVVLFGGVVGVGDDVVEFVGVDGWYCGWFLRMWWEVLDD